MSFFLPSSSEYSTNFQSSASIPSIPLTVETTSGPATVSLVHPSHPPPNWQINLIEINPTLKLLRTFNADDFLRIDCSKKGSFNHPLRPYSPNRPNNLILIMREKLCKFNLYEDLPDYFSTKRIESSLKGSFSPPFPLIPSLTETKTTTQKTESWLYKHNFGKNVLIPRNRSHEFRVNVGTIPDNERDPTNNDGVKTSKEFSTKNNIPFVLNFSISPKLNRHADMCFSIVSTKGVIWTYNPHTGNENTPLKNILIGRHLIFQIRGSSFFDKKFSFEELIKDPHIAQFPRQLSDVTKFTISVENKSEKNNSFTVNTSFKIEFKAFVPSFSLLKNINTVVKRNCSREETQYARPSNMERRVVVHHIDTQAVTSSCQNAYSAPSSSASLLYARKKKLTSEDAPRKVDVPSLKKRRINKFHSRNSSTLLVRPTSQIPLNERPTFGFLPHDPELAEFFASFNSPMDSSLNLPSPPNFDFPQTDDALTKLYESLGISDETHRPDSNMLNPLLTAPLLLC